MFRNRDSRITRFVLILFFTLAVLYGIFEARGQILGPSIEIVGLPQLSHDPFIHIKGQASRISSISMDGRQINVTEQGNFDEPYLLAPGYNRIALDAKDSYGRTSERIIVITYVPIESSATSSAASTTGGATSSPPSASSTVPIAPTS